MSVEWYLPSNKIIVASNGMFIIEEIDGDYILFNKTIGKQVMRCKNVNYFRAAIGEIYEII